MTRLALVRCQTIAPLALVSLLLVACDEDGRGGMFPVDGGGGSGRACGGFAGATCSADEFCDFAADTCGVADEQGRCRARPDACDDQFEPVCGCDGVIHANACDANAAGTDVSSLGSCPVPAGQFACGFRTCETTTEYCQRAVSDIGGEPDSFQCKPLPAACDPSASCECLALEPCGALCEEVGAGALRLTCPGG